MKKLFVSFFLISCCLFIFFSCQKEISLETGNTQIAAGSLTDSNGNCLPDTVIGTFYNGVTPGSDTAYVEIQVNVTQTGSYSIYSDLENGFEFADSGVFTTTGINTIRLKPIGTPIVNVSTLFNINFDTTFCSFTVNVQDSTGTGLGGTDTTGSGDPDTTVNIGDNAWQFATSSHVFQGSLINAQYGPATIGTQLFLVGQMQSNSPDTSFGLTVQFPGNTLDTGLYQTSFAGTNFALTKTVSGDIIFAANVTSSQVVSIHIISYDAVTKIVSGTFSGTAYDFNGSDVPVLGGAFKATVQ